MWTQVLYNAAAVYCRMGQWERAAEVLVSISQDRGGSRTGVVEAAMESIEVSAAAYRAHATYTWLNLFS